MPKGNLVFAVNAGGSAYTSIDGIEYVADIFGVGNSYSKTAAIAGTEDDILYQSEVWASGGFTYDIPVTNGFYVVELNFAEIYSGAFAPGERTFDVFLEGQQVLDNFDIFTESGGANTAYVVEYLVEVTDGFMTLTTSAEVENPKISAFSIWEPDGPDIIPPVVTISVENAVTAADPALVTVTYTDAGGLNTGTISLGDLVISTVGPSIGILAQDLQVAGDGLSATATYSVRPIGGWTTDPVVFSVADAAIADLAGNGNTSIQTIYSYAEFEAFAGIIPIDTYGPSDEGRVLFSVTPGSGIETSNYGTNSFTVTNTGDKRIAAVYLDVQRALFPDTVFDPVGLAGDSVSRGLLFGNVGGTGAVQPGSNPEDPDVLDPFFGIGGTAGYEGMLIQFDPLTDNGFETGEFASFGVDMDPNSIAGIPQQPLDINGADPRLNSWDIGGVSGAELIGSTITVLFTDGTTASGQLMGDGSQGGAIALVDQGLSQQSVELEVNGVAEGGSGTYNSNGASVVITGPAGETARVVMAFGFAQPFDYIAPDGTPISAADLLTGDPFGVNNALEFQTVDVVLTGIPQDISNLFDFTPPGGSLSFDGDDALPIAFTTSVINGSGQPIGPVTSPIYLQADIIVLDVTAPAVQISMVDPADANTAATVTVVYSDDIGLDPATISLNDLTITTAGPAVQILTQNLQISGDGLSATATYSVLPAGGWTTENAVSFSVAGGAVMDVAGNSNSAEQTTFTYDDTPQVSSLADFTQLALQNVSINNPTTINVGTDGKLYVTQQDGLLIALTIEKNEQTVDDVLTVVWTVTDREDITIIQDMPNHDDQGNYQSGTNTRQVTGALTTVDEWGNVMLYITSSDPRIGGGGGGTDTNLDTNSGIVSRLKQVVDATGTPMLDANGQPTWEKVDLVRGFVRSEENHSINGLVLTTNSDGASVLLLTIGGSTNAGAQSNSFAYTPEYYYSSSMVTIDLDKLDAMETAEGLKTYDPGDGNIQYYLYDLPTLDDPTRTNDLNGGDLAGDGSQTSDVFGGNDGLNQAIHDPLGIVEIIATGFRNQYDVTITESGAVYTIDNGANAGWGGAPVNANGELIVDADGDGLADNGPAINLSSELGNVSTADGLHRIDDDFATPDTVIYYAGHPNLYRAYGADAGVYLYASSGNEWGVPPGTPLTIVNGALTPTSEPTDLASLISNIDEMNPVDAFGNPILDERQAVFNSPDRIQGATDSADGALYTWYASTNGLDEYTASNGLQGQLLAVSFDGNIYAITIGPDGEVSNVESRGLTSAPLDVVAQGDNDPYPGVIFVAAYGADQIVILSPDKSVGVTPNPNDRDNDGLDDTYDPFAADPNNGTSDIIGLGDVLNWSFANSGSEVPPNDNPDLFDGTAGLYNGGDIGFTGIMTNRGGLPETLYTQQNIIFGGAPGILQVKSVDSGSPEDDTQRNGFQFGVTPGAGIDGFTYESTIDNFLDEIGEIPAGVKLSQGIFVGAGDQNNFVSLSLVRLADGRVGFEVMSQFAFDFIGELPVETTFYEIPELALATSLDTIDLAFEITVDTGLVVPTWTYKINSVETSGAGSAVTLQGDALKALQGTFTLGDDSGNQIPVGFAVGVLSTRESLAPGAVITAFSAGGDESFTTIIDGQSVTFVPDTSASGVAIFGNSNVFGTSETLDVTNSVLDELYTEERFSASYEDWGYSISTGNGSFYVDLYFAETWSGAFADGARVFDISIEGINQTSNFDIYSVAGGANLESIQSYEVVVTDGTLDITFANLVQNAKVNAILVRENPNTGTFAADWDDIEIRAHGEEFTHGNLILGVNAGGGAYTSIDGVEYAADNFSVGNAYSGTTAIAGTEDDELYQSETWAAGGFTYDIAVDNGFYFVEMNFAEIYSGTSNIGGRVFDVLLEGELILDDFDIYQTVGSSNRAHVVEYLVEVTDGSLTLSTIAEIENPKISAFSIWEALGGVGPDLAPPSVTIGVENAVVADDPALVTVTYTDAGGLNTGTISLGDLVISTVGPSIEILAQDLQVAGDGLSATATYSVRPIGGWTSDPVVFSVADAAIADLAGNGNTLTEKTFVYEEPTPFDTFVFAVNAGGNEYTDLGGVIYAADTFGVGNSYNTSRAIANTEDDALYQSEVWADGGFTYEIAVANGTYLVEMLFAEIYSGNFSAGARVFDILLEGQLVVDDFDIFLAAGGGDIAYSISSVVEVTDGSLTLTTTDEMENSKISAFSIWADDFDFFI